MRVCRMNYIIDGHNLIAKIPGLDLSMLDDEQRLIELLKRYGQHSRGRIEVFFDGAPVGQAGAQNYGRVHAHFVIQSQTADDAIQKRLVRLGRAARNWVVVTSDRSVQSAAHTAHAQVMSAEDFAELLQTSLLRASLQAPTGNVETSRDKPLSEAEVNEWLTIFKERGKPK
jgi:predicted RNA-binding protein with PIN domain